MWQSEVFLYWTRANRECVDENKPCHLMDVDCGHKAAGIQREERRNYVLCPSVAPRWALSCLLVINTLVPIQLHRFTAEEQRLIFLWSHFEHQIFVHKDSKSFPPFWAAQKSDQTVSFAVWFFRGQAGRRGTCSCRCSVPALHHNKGNLNALLFYVHCCKVLQGHCGPYKTESCQIHREGTCLDWERWFIYVGYSERPLIRAAVIQHGVDFILWSTFSVLLSASPGNTQREL